MDALTYVGEGERDIGGFEVRGSLRRYLPEEGMYDIINNSKTKMDMETESMDLIWSAHEILTLLYDGILIRIAA